MTDGLDQRLGAAALVILGNADLMTPPLAAFASTVPDGTNPPYVLLYTDISWPADAESNALDGLSRTMQARWICHCVGGSDIASRAVAQRVRSALLDRRPQVTGLDCNMIKQESSQDPIRDESTGVVVMDAIQVYRTTATVL